jgi:hypothetical protein
MQRAMLRCAVLCAMLCCPVLCSAPCDALCCAALCCVALLCVPPSGATWHQDAAHCTRRMYRYGPTTLAWSMGRRPVGLPVLWLDGCTGRPSGGARLYCDSPVSCTCIKARNLQAGLNGTYGV